MTGDGAYRSFDDLVVLVLLPVGVLVGGWLLGSGAWRLSRARERQPLLDSAASLAWGAAVALYSWGLERALFLDDQAQARVCRAATGSDQVAGYDPSFVPLRFGCVVGDGHVVDAGVFPHHLNLAVAVLALVAVTLTVASRQWASARPVPAGCG
ncbi:hypothetical protein [Kitasatospora sp. LaBMicrA B282]|uniref:hypothetical protein n=1 Tax=Kitasatospora sp. LaBMicrA B282 TaxID=3420949 RepID=UPI003D0E599E